MYAVVCACARKREEGREGGGGRRGRGRGRGREYSRTAIAHAFQHVASHWQKERDELELDERSGAVVASNARMTDEFAGDREYSEDGCGHAQTHTNTHTRTCGHGECISVEELDEYVRPYKGKKKDSTKEELKTVHALVEKLQVCVRART